MLTEGTYAGRHRAAPAPLRWSHAARFRFARRLVQPFAGGRLLDYGCGDGTFLASVGDLFPHAVGAEVDPFLVADAERRLAGTGLRFVHVGELADEADGGFQLTVCMEVLEHCATPELDEALRVLRRLTALDGRLVVSVPIETGPVLLVKQAARALAAARGVEGYRQRERYTAGELVRMVLGRSGGVARPLYRTTFADGTPNRYHGHKGFDWRALRRRLEARFQVEAVRFSPFPRLPAAFNSQAWLVCRPR